MVELVVVGGGAAAGVDAGAVAASEAALDMV